MSDLALGILAVVMIGMLGLPFIVNYHKQKRKNNLLKERLRSEAKVEHLPASAFQTWRDSYCIVLDPTKAELHFLNALENKIQRIDLSQVRICRPIRTYRELNEGKESRQIIRKVSLVFDRLDEQKNPFEITLYDEFLSHFQLDEWEIALNWSKKINSFIMG